MLLKIGQLSFFLSLALTAFIGAETFEFQARKHMAWGVGQTSQTIMKATLDGANLVRVGDRWWFRDPITYATFYDAYGDSSRYKGYFNVEWVSNGQGHAKWLVREENESSNGRQSGPTVLFPIDGTVPDTGSQVKLQVHAYTEGEEDDDYEYLWYDNAPPSFTLSSNASTGWVGAKISTDVRITGATDPHSGLKRVSYNVDGGSWKNVALSFPKTVLPPVEIGDGQHFIEVKIVDNVNNSKTLRTGTFKVDLAAPTVPSIVTMSLGSLASTPGDETQISVSWSPSSDSSSGLQSYLISTDSLSTTAPSTWTEVGTEVTSTTISVPYNPDDPTTVHFWVAAKDQVGNISAWSHKTFEIPDPLKISSTPTVAHEQNVRYLISVPFTIPYQDLKKYSKITLTRLNGQSGRPLPGAVTSASMTFTPNGQDLGGGWSTGSDGYAVYTDEILASSGAGHRWIRYAVTAEVANMPFSGNTSDEVALPNNKGWVEVTVLDSKGRVYTKGGKDPQFGFDATRWFTVKYTAADYDGDDWQYEVDRVTLKKGDKGTVKIVAPLTGDFLLPYPYQGGYSERSVDVKLSEGPNNLVLYWTEGAADDQAVTSEFPIVSITLDKQPIGGYLVYVSDIYGNNIPTDDAAIRTRPGERLEFSATPPAGSPGVYTWEFGDGTSTPNSPTADHVYRQGNDQSTNKYTYTLRIHDGTNSIALSVEVYDTEDGDLLVDETWRGPHQVTGIVRVPPERTLTIASGTTLSFHGSLGWLWDQGLRIEGRLVIEGGAVLKKLDGQDPGWGTIYVTGRADVGAAEVRDAKRGLTVVGPGQVNLVGTSLRNNLTGVHLLGPVGATLNSVRFEDNTTYGLKEDAGARPRLTNSVFRNNRWNYYQWDYGILGIGEVNNLSGNAGNREE